MKIVFFAFVNALRAADPFPPSLATSFISLRSILPFLSNEKATVTLTYAFWFPTSTFQQGSICFSNALPIEAVLAVAFCDILETTSALSKLSCSFAMLLKAELTASTTSSLRDSFSSDAVWI